MINYNMYCFSEYEKDFTEPPIVEYCKYCKEALRVGYDVIRWYDDYFCNIDEFILYIESIGMEIDEVLYKGVTL